MSKRHSFSELHAFCDKGYRLQDHRLLIGDCRLKRGCTGFDSIDL